MRLYEYEGKMLFKEFGIPVPQSVLIGDPRELDKVIYPAVLKAQVFIGKRGKAGAIKIVNSRQEAELEIKNLLGRVIAGYEVKSVLIEEKIDIKKELYLSAIIDRKLHKPLILASSEGGMEIEEVAKSNPDAIVKHYLEVGEYPEGWTGRWIARAIGIPSSLISKASSIINQMYKLFLDYECKLVEINPLAITKDGNLVALDSKVDLDEDAMYRHPELKKLGISARHEVGELTEREKIAKKAGVPYVDLDGDIGVFPGGAGFGIASIDLIKHFGGNPANFMDSGGAPTQERLRLMIDLLMKNPRVKVIFGARFGGISRCDDWARAICQYIIENKPEKPMIMRMAGNMEQEGRKIFEKYRHEEPELFKDIKIYKFDTPIEEVIKETIKIAK
ncbi:succinate--CoA ligase subunit beta [candidate division WOR-3 bacterium]|nr:succinate--CoA ligase subunit beta [candidate division WOR-3 bacterium]